MSKRWTAADIERLRTRTAKPAPPDVVGHPAAREATHSSTEAADALAYFEEHYPLSRYPERRAMRERLRAHVERMTR